ncbi:MAG: ATP-binding protein [Deltaproteobacteria bacterium]|nr:ATP-binding protein [Deltaproteobacteria bacterium]
MRVPRLAHELALAHAVGSLSALLAKLAKLDLLLLDDFLLAPPKDQEQPDLLEILEDRYGKRSTIITGQLPIKNWDEALADPTIADAICGRVVPIAPSETSKDSTRPRPTFNPKIPEAKILELATGAFISRRENVCLVGPTGVGKSHIAQAIGHRACLAGANVAYVSAHEVLLQLRAGRADATYDRRLLRGAGLSAKGRGARSG